MNKLSRLRMLSGFISAWVTSIVVAFLAGCIFAAILQDRDTPGFVTSVASGHKDAVDFLLFVGGASALVATVLASLILGLIGLPLSLIVGRHTSISLNTHIVAGAAIALIVSAAYLLVQNIFNPSVLWNELYFWVITILIAGPVSAISFWFVTQRLHGSK